MSLRSKFLLSFFSCVALTCSVPGVSLAETVAGGSSEKLTIYTARNSDTDLAVFEEFAGKNGIKLEIVSGKAAELIDKLEQEKSDPVADLFITVDGGVLDTAKQKDLLQAADAKEIWNNIPASLRDEDRTWVGLSTRARVIVYSKDRVKPEQLSTYEDLADPKWKGKIVMRPASALYDQSLLASLIAINGEAEAAEWVKGVVANFARAPKGNDRAQAKDILAGTGDLTLMNTYYLGRMLNGKDEKELAAANAVGVFFPNQESSGTHINICGIGIVRGAPNPVLAEQLIVYLTSIPAQEQLVSGNYEFPANPQAKMPELLESWGQFKTQSIDFAVLRENNGKAKELFEQGGWE